MNETWRLFFAVPLDQEVKQRFKSALAAASIRAPGSAVKPANWHFTLFFAGETAPENAGAMSSLAREVRASGFELSIERLGAFPSSRRARVFWAGVGEGHERLINLAGDLTRRLRLLDFLTDEKSYHPHLTLSRLRYSPRNLSELVKSEFVPVRFRVERFVLYRSRDGCYEELESFPLD